MTAAGVVSDYDEDVQEDLVANFAETVGVNEEDVTLTITAASVNLLFVIVVPDAAAAVAVSSTVASELADTTAATAALGVTVTSAPAATGLPCFPAPEGAWCYSVGSDETTCNMYFVLTPQGPRSCKWIASVGKCRLKGERYSGWPSCAAVAAPPPMPPSPPSTVACYSAVQTQGVDWCFQLELGQDSECAAYYQQFGSNYRRCVPDPTRGAGHCTGGGARMAEPPAPQCESSFDGCYTPLEDAGYSWCYQLPADATCAAFYKQKANGKYAQCSDHPSGSGCIGGGAGMAAPPEPSCAI